MTTNTTDMDADEGRAWASIIARAVAGEARARALIEQAGGEEVVDRYQRWAAAEAGREAAAARQRAEQAEAARRDKLRGVARISDAMRRGS